MQLSQVGAQNQIRYTPRSTSAAEAAPAQVSDGFTASNGVAAPDVKSFVAQTKEAEAPKTFVYSDSGGRINHLAFQLDGQATGKIRQEVFAAWTTVFKNLDDDVKVTISLESQRDKAAVTKLIQDNGIPNMDRFNLLVADDLNITMWARDQMVGLGSDQGPILLGQTTMRPHGDDELLPPRIAAANPELGFDPDKRLQTDGGDEVSNGQETFLGYTSLFLTAERLYKTAQAEAGKSASFSPFSKELKMDMPHNQAAVPDFRFESNIFKSTDESIPNQAHWLQAAHNLFEEKYGHSVTIVGQDDPSTPEFERPATFHMDMGMTPVDNDTIFVGNPKAAVDILKGLSPEEYQEHNRLLNESLGRPANTDTLGELIHTNTVEEADLQHQFDYNTANVEAKGYSTDRLPYLQGPPGVSWITYNNCLMENYINESGENVRRVFLPTYGLPALDNAAKEVYTKHGFDVIPLKLPALTSWRGAIRCISNVLDRGPAAPPPAA